MSIADKLTTVAENQQRVFDSGKKAAYEQVCPEINESGTIVTCEPVLGYPLTVTTSEDATQVIRCGKNLLGYENFSGVTSTANTQSCENGIFTKAFTTSVNSTWLLTTACDVYRKKLTIPPGVYVFSMAIVEEHFTNANEKITDVYALVKLADGSTIELENGKPTTLTQSGTVTQIRANCQIKNNGTYIKFTLQLEAEQGATPHEVYKDAETFAVGELVPASPGVNTIWADTGEVTVTGRADPVAIIENLTTAIISYGGNV